MKIKELLDDYYKGLDQKRGWEISISDGFKFIGGDMTIAEPVVGKQKYVEIIGRLSRIFEHVRVQEMMVDNDKAIVIANYDWTFPNGKRINGNVAEIWKIKDDKLDELTIYFDTLTFQLNTK